MLKSYRLAITGSLIALVFCLGCGKTPDDPVDGSIKAPVLSGSTLRGIYFTGNQADNGIASSTVFFYDFTTGSISRVSTMDGKDSLVAYDAARSQLLVFTRSAKVFRVIELSSGEPIDGKSGRLNLETGDPKHFVVPQSSIAILANSGAKAVQVLEFDSGYLNPAPLASLLSLPSGLSSFYPVCVAADGAAAWAAATGLDLGSVSPTAKSAGIVYALDRSGGTLAFNDLDGTTSGIQGVPLRPSHPTFCQKTSDGKKLRFYGLCASSFGATCRSGGTEVSLSTKAASELSGASMAAYDYFSWIVAGATDDEIYSHVTNSAGQSLVVRASISGSSSVKEAAALSELGLGMLYFDKSSSRLFIGTKDGGVGKLLIYRNESIEATVVTQEIPWFAAEVPK